MMAYCVVVTVLISRDTALDKTGVLHLQSSDMDGITKTDTVVQYSHCNVEKWEEWSKKALREEIMSELHVKGSEKETGKNRGEGNANGSRGPTRGEQEQRHIGKKHHDVFWKYKHMCVVGV